ncbi:MAG TPA: hypothetical protein VI790_01130 [Candidatus Nanoarchaeia archaeon]|nr:hypothetical protein [Candidatus Nanoarchaeia archaeon]
MKGKQDITVPELKNNESYLKIANLLTNHMTNYSRMCKCRLMSKVELSDRLDLCIANIDDLTSEYTSLELVKKELIKLIEEGFDSNNGGTNNNHIKDKEGLMKGIEKSIETIINMYKPIIDCCCENKCSEYLIKTQELNDDYIKINDEIKKIIIKKDTMQTELTI